MNSLNLNQLGGLPFTQPDLKWLQDNYSSAFAAIANLIGDKVIVSGMVEAGGNVTNGWIALNGELIPFVGGAIGTGEYVINEVITNRTFNDGGSKPVRISRVAQFSAGGAYLYSDLVRIATLKEGMPKTGDIKEIYCDNVYMDANFDGDGYGINERVGWRILSKAYPATAGKTFVNYDEADDDFDTLLATGGEKEVELTENELPEFSIETPKKKNDIDRGVSGAASTWSVDESDVNNIGNGEAHNNMQPYMVILKIVKL